MCGAGLSSGLAWSLRLRRRCADAGLNRSQHSSPTAAKPAAASLSIAPGEGSALTCRSASRRFQATVGIINGVDVAKFPAILTRLIKKLHTKVMACCTRAPSCAKRSSDLLAHPRRMTRSPGMRKGNWPRCSASAECAAPYFPLPSVW